MVRGDNKKMAQANPRQNIKWDIKTTPMGPTIVAAEVAKCDQSIKKCGSRMCDVPTDTILQLLCTNFLYDSDNKYCTFRRFGDMGVCDYTPEGYDNVVKFNAETEAKRKDKKYNGK